MNVKIVSFQGNYRFLSNFFLCHVPYEHIVYRSAEHAFVAAKVVEPWTRLEVSNISSPGEAKKFGRKVKLREGWDEIKLIEMEKILRSKFAFNPHLYAALKSTRDAELIEGNWWGDTFWGMCEGVGENHLGKLLMKIRSEI